MYFVNRRWMGGMLTNFSTVKKRIERLQELRKMQQEGQFESMPKKEAKRLQDELDRLMFHFDGIADMKRLPGVSAGNWITASPASRWSSSIQPHAA